MSEQRPENDLRDSAKPTDEKIGRRKFLAAGGAATGAAALGGLAQAQDLDGRQHTRLA